MHWLLGNDVIHGCANINHTRKCEKFSIPEHSELRPPLVSYFPNRMDTRLQNFWKESINKEMTLRFAWQARYANKDRSNKKTAGVKPTIAPTANMAAHNSIAGKIKRLEVEIRAENSDGNVSQSMNICSAQARTAADAGGAPASDMRPASALTRSLLYKGLSVHGEGRYAYLKRRKMIVPDQKYLYPVLSSSDYGWKILDHAKLERSPHGHASVIKASFYRNSGIIFQQDMQ